MSSTVFITNKSPSHEYSPASRYGAIRFVTMGNYPVFKTQRLQEEIIKVLVHSSPDDYLLLSGSSVIAALCMAIWLTMHPVVKLLMWDRAENEYVLRVIERSSIQLGVVEAQDVIAGLTSIPGGPSA